MIEDSLAHPTKGERRLRRFLVGAVLSLTTIFIVPFILLLGYWARTVRESAGGSDEPPGFGNPGELFVDGSKVLGVVLMYFVAPVTLIGLVADIGSLAPVPVLPEVVPMFIAPIFTAAIYLFPGTASKVATEGDVMLAFNLDVIRDVAERRAYFFANLKCFVGLLLFFGATLLTLGVLLVALPYLLAVFSGRLYGLAHREMYGDGSETDSPRA